MLLQLKVRFLWTLNKKVKTFFGPCLSFFFFFLLKGATNMWHITHRESSGHLIGLLEYFSAFIVIYWSVNLPLDHFYNNITVIKIEL